MSIASQLNGLRYESLTAPKSVHYDVQTMVFTFEDSSQAKLITLSEPCEPYIAASTTTMSQRPYRVWKEVKE